MKKTVLVDLSKLNNIHCGLGQTSLAYGRYFEKNYNKNTAKFDLTLLVPDNMIGEFGNEVNYISSSNKLTKRFQFLLPKFDVWHATNHICRFMPAHSQTKLILTVHDLNHLYERKGINKAIKHFKTQLKINRADEIVCISEFTKLEVERNLKLGDKKCKVILNHVELLNDEVDLKPDLMLNSPFFFNIGVIQKKKNIHVLLDLMKLYPDKQLYIAGKEDKNSDYALMIRKRIHDEHIKNVTMMGPISQSEKIWMFKHCEAFLFPSLFEGFGLPVIEAMQFGKPVFSSKETSLKEIGGKYSFFWDNFDSNYMKSVIDNSLSHFYTDNKYIQSEIEYAKSFTSNKQFEEFEKLYETI